MPVLVATVVAGCGGEQAAAPPTVPVQLVTLHEGTVRETSEYIASLRSRRSVTVQPQVEGQISRHRCLCRDWLQPL